MSETVVQLRRKGDGRKRILLVAMKQFAEKGFDAVTIRDIAAEAGVSVGLINHHFESKIGLQHEVDEFFFKRFSAAFEQGFEKMAARDLAAISEWSGDWIQKYKDEWPVFVQYLRRALLVESDWGAELFRRYFQLIRSHIDRLDAEGRLGANVDRLTLPFLFLFLEAGPLLLDPYIQKTLGKSAYDTDMWRRFQAAITDLVWNGTGANASPPSPPKTGKGR